MGVTLVGPVKIILANALTVPLTFVVDMMFKGLTVSGLSLLGAAIVFVSFCDSLSLPTVCKNSSNPNTSFLVLAGLLNLHELHSSQQEAAEGTEESGAAKAGEEGNSIYEQAQQEGAGTTLRRDTKLSRFYQFVSEL